MRVNHTSYKWRDFQEARAFARSLNLSKHSEWLGFCRAKMLKKGKLPDDIPETADRAYRNQGWVNWGDWLGTGAVATKLRQYRTFNEAREFVRSLKLMKAEEWHTYCNGLLPDKGTRPADIPTNPQNTYKTKGWVSWGDWLGTRNVHPKKIQWREFKSAREYVRSLGIANWKEWREYVRGSLPEKGQLPSDIPRLPGQAYRGQGWLNWYDWLGKGKA